MRPTWPKLEVSPRELQHFSYFYSCMYFQCFQGSLLLESVSKLGLFLKERIYSFCLSMSLY